MYLFNLIQAGRSKNQAQHSGDHSLYGHELWHNWLTLQVTFNCVLERYEWMMAPTTMKGMEGGWVGVE